MADIESNIKVNIDTSDALSQLKLLQQQISAFQQAMKNAGAQNASAAVQMQQNLMTSINATGKFSANIQTIKTSAESFTESLEKNKLSIGQYFRYAGGASKTFGKLFKSEFETIQQVAVDRVKTIQTQYIKLGRDASGAMKAIAVRPLALDMDNLGTKTQIAAQKQQLFNQLMKQGSTQLLNFGKNTQWAGRQLMVGFTIPLTLMGQAAAQAYMKIEAASLKFRRVYGDMNTTTEETNKMVKSVQALANEFTKYGIAVADTMDMAAQAAAMGKTGTDLMQQVAQASKLSVLGQVEQQQALETTISLTNAFGISTDELAKSVDFLNAVENQTVVSIEDLTIAIPKAAPVVKQLGGDVEDLTFFLTAMKEGGINASEGANALKSGLASMINPTKKASDFLAQFGVNIKAIVEGNKGDIKGTVVDFAKALDTLDPLNRARAIEQMFGKFQFSRLSTLFKNVIDEGSQAATVAGLANQTAEELAVLSEREMSKISDSPMFKFQKSIQDMQTKLAPVGEAFLKAVTPIIEFVTKILDGFNNLSEGTKSFVSILVLAVAGIGPALLMTFGLIANGVANIMKLFTNMKAFINKTTKPSDVLGEQTSYMNTEQLKSAAIAASLDQAHAKLRQTFTSEAAAVQQLTDAYRNAVQAQQAYSGIPGIPTGNPNATPRKYANGVSMVPGPSGAGDIVPALLSPGEAVIPARSAKKYAPVIRGMIAGNLPGFEDGTPGAGMRQSMIGPMTEKQIEGLARTGKTLKEISDEVYAGPYGQTPPTNYGTQITPSAGHSFPAFGVAGVYEKPDGTKVFVKPQMDLVSAMAEIRGTTIARDVHGLVAPKQSLRVMMDPTDPEDKRKFLVLESALDERLANVPTEFTKDQYFKQLVASLLRGDKDLGVGNLGGNVLADVGPAGVFQRASGKRALGSQINSMEEQAIINLLGVKGGAKRFFAEATSDIAKSMTPAEYDAAIKAEIQAVAPRLQATIAGFGNLNPEEKAAYMAMQQRLQAGMGVDWAKYQVMHSKVPTKKLAEGGFVGIENSQSFAQSLMSMSSDEIKKQLNINDTHLVTPIDLTKNPQVLKQITDILPGVTKEELRGFEPVSNLTAQLPANMNQKMKTSGYPSSTFSSIWNGFVGKLSKSATIAGIDLPSSQIIEDELGTQIAAAGGNITDGTINDIIGNVLGKSSKVTDINESKQKLYSLALKVAQLRSKPKQLSQSGNDSIHSIVLRMIRDGSAQFNDNGTSIVRTIGQGNVTRFGTWEFEGIGTGKEEGTIEQKEIRRRAQEAAYGSTGWASLRNWNAPMPTVNRELVKPKDWAEVTNPATWNRMTKEQQRQYLSTIQGTKPTTLGFRKQDYEQGFGDNKGPASGWTYDSSKLKAGIKWRNSEQAMQMGYNEMAANGIIPSAGQAFFNKLALGKEPVRMAEGGIVPGGMGKPKASVFDVDDTLLDLASFMPAHQERNAKLPKEQRLNWWEEVAKDPKGIPAAIQRLKDAQMRGNKILLMTARPKTYDAVTLDTLQKLGIDTKGVKLISRENKDYRKPEQMKYDKTSKYMQWYDIEEFYDDMAKTRGAVSLLGINTINPLKLAKGGVVPGYAKGTPRVLDTIEQKFPGMFTQLPKSRMMQYSEGATKPEANKKVFTSSRLKSFKFEDWNRTYDLDELAQIATMITQGEFSGIGKSVYSKKTGKYKRIGVPTFDDLLVNGKPILQELPGYQKYSLGYEGEEVYAGIARNKIAMLQSLQDWIYQDDWGKEASEFTVNGIPAKTFFKGLSLNQYRVPGQKTKSKPYFFADGVFSVPGPKGAGDVVPAMLSPGEAVIPAKQAAQHRPMIQQMIAGNLPGYIKGSPGVGINSVFSSEVAMESGKPLNVNIVKDETAKSDKPLEILQPNSKVTILTREQIEEQMSIEDEVYRQLLEKEKELKLKHVLTEEERKLLESNKQIMLKKEEAFKLQKNVTEKEKRGFFTRNATTGKVQGAMYGLSAAAGLASTVPGAVGESAQQMLPVIGAATAAMSVIPGYAGMIVGAGAALVTAYMQVQDKLNKIRDEALALGTAMGSSTKSIDKFAEFAKTVTGSQAMDKRRETSAGSFFNVVQGKTTFGESYMKSDAGKELVKSVGAAIKGGGLDQAKAMIVNQLGTAIASGALSPAQARSIASNLGAQLGDMSLGIEVAGKITDLVGPKGEDLKKEPLEIRMRLVAESMEQFKKQAEISNANVNDTAKNAGTSGAGIGLGMGAGAAAGGIALGAASLMGGVASSSAIVAGLATAGSAVPVIGTIIGALVGFSIAAVQLQGDIAKNAGYLQASLGSALSVQQQMVDSLTVDYEKRIQAAKAAGDTAEATRLQNQYLADQAELLQFNKEQTQEMYSILESQGTGLGFMLNAQIANLDTAREGLKKAFEGSGQEVQAKLAQEQIDSMAGSATQKTMLMSAVAQKQIGLNQIGVAKTAFGADQAGADTLQTLMENSPTELNRTLGLAGNMGAVEQKKFVLDMSLKDPIEAKVMNDAVELAQKTTGVFFGEKKTAEAIMKFAVENPEKMLEFQQNVAELKDVDGAKFDITVAQKILGPDLAKALGEKSVGAYFKKYNKQNKVVFLSEFQQVMTMLQEGDKDMIDSYNAWNASNGMKKTYADYAAWQSDRTVTTQGVDNTKAPGEDGGTGEKAGPQASILDQFVQMARETSNFQQKLTTGWDASLAALKRYTITSINLLAGWAVRLKQQGVSANMIDVFMGATEEEQDKIINKRTGALLPGALDLLRKLQIIKDKKEFGLSYVLASPTERLAKDNGLYQAGLDVIANKEKKINEKYDKRIKALDQIGKIQEKNNQRQQDTLTIADALSKGDIAAAARAALTAKQNSQRLALEDAKESTELARKTELEAITVKILGETQTRSDLEAIIATNTEKIAANKLVEMNRQITIGRNAVIAAEQSAILLANSTLISKLPGANGGGSSTGSGKGNGGKGNGGKGDGGKGDGGKGDKGGNNANDTDSKPTGVVGNIASSVQGKAFTAAIKGAQDVTPGALKAAQDYATAKKNAGASMSDAAAEKKFGGKNTPEFKKWKANQIKLAKALTAAQDYGLVDSYGNVLTADQVTNATTYQKNTMLSSKSGQADAAESLKGIPAEIASRAKLIKNSNKDFAADKTKLDEMKKTFEKAGGILYMLPGYYQTWLNTSDALRPTTPFGKLIAKGAKPEELINQATKMATKFGEIDNYRKELRTAGYTESMLFQAKLFDSTDGRDGQTLKQSSDFASGQMFNPHKPYTGTNIGYGKNQILPDAENMLRFANQYYAMGGMVYANKGLKVAASKYALGTDTIPAMLTAGEFVMRKSAVDRIGSRTLTKMNDGTSSGDSVYNYSITLNVNSSSDSNDIADAVLRQIKRIDSQRIRSSAI